MTARQPRTPQEAAMLDPMALMSMPRPNMPRGLFGSVGRRRGAPHMRSDGPSYSDDGGQDMTAPPVTSAPPPPANWKTTLGPELLAQLPAPSLQSDPLQPAPPMRGGPFINRGMFGTVPSTMAPQQLPGTTSDKIGNRGAPPMLDANGKGKKGFDWRMLAGIVGDGLLGLNGQPGVYGPAMWKRRQDEANHAQRLAEMREQNRLKLAEPDFATVNNRRVRIDPTTGQADVLYAAPQDFDDYAASLGAEPGTPEYDRLVQDYVLRGSGPTATDNYNTREEWRQDNRLELEGERQGNRIGLQDRRQTGQRALKATPSYRQANPLPPRTGSRSGGGGGVREGQTATNPQTGARVVYRGGKWVPAK